MKFICHRGYWLQREEGNTLAAFQRAFEAGYGAEIDVRDDDGELVVLHDVPLPTSIPLPLKKVVELYHTFAGEYQLAINVKSSGLASRFIDLLDAQMLKNAFFFDLAVPDALDYTKRKLRVFTRQSEYEEHPAFYDEAAGVWMDEFENHWITPDDVLRHVQNRKEVCIVSPELQGRDYKGAWLDYRKLYASHQVMLCTDFPDEARRFFTS